MPTLQNLEEKIQKLGEQFILPYTKEIDQEARFPKEAYEALKQQGFMGLLVPKEYGGLQGGNLDHVEVCYNLARFNASTALCYMMHNVATACVSHYGTAHQKSLYLPKIAKGEATFALAYSESGSGTHFVNPDITESQKGEKRILEGRKSFVTSAQQANYYLTYTNSCKLQGKKNNWIVPSNHPSLTHEEGVWNGFGMRGNVSKPVQYNQVELEVADCLLGSEGDGENQINLVAMYFVTGLGAVYSGVGMAAYECVLQHCLTRKYSDGKDLADNELVRIHLAELYTKTQSQIALVREAARAFDSGASDAPMKVFACRINATHLVMEICELAMRLGGGKAYSKHLPLEQYLRDAMASQVMAPSLDVLKIWLGNAITNKG